MVIIMMMTTTDTKDTDWPNTCTGGRLKVAQRQFSSIRNEYEITFDANSEIMHCQDDAKIQTAVYNFKKVKKGPLSQSFNLSA